MLKRISAALLTGCAVLGLSACTTVITDAQGGIDPASKPVTQEQVDKTAPDAAFWGGEAESKYQKEWAFFCKQNYFPDPSATSPDTDPQLTSFTAKTNPLNAVEMQVAQTVTAFPNRGAAKKFTELALDKLKDCPAQENFTFESTVANYTYVPTDYSHSGWTGSTLLSKISTTSKDGSNNYKSVQVSAVVVKGNISVLLNIYGFSLTDPESALAATTTLINQAVDELDK
jgi:hypothetical protein